MNASCTDLDEPVMKEKLLDQHGVWLMDNGSGWNDSV
jgi:hypothetical protein